MSKKWRDAPTPCALCHEDIKCKQEYRKAGSEYKKTHRERIANDGAQYCHEKCYKRISGAGGSDRTGGHGVGRAERQGVGPPCPEAEQSDGKDAQQTLRLVTQQEMAALACLEKKRNWALCILVPASSGSPPQQLGAWLKDNWWGPWAAAGNAAEIAAAEAAAGQRVVEAIAAAAEEEAAPPAWNVGKKRPHRAARAGAVAAIAAGAVHEKLAEAKAVKYRRRK